jgi:fatty acid desaturase
MRELGNKKGPIHSAVADIRESMNRPNMKWASSLLTWITGKPLSGQMPLFGSPWSQLATTLLQLAVGFAGATLALAKGWPFWTFLPLCWLLTTSAARKIQVMLVHECSHLTFSRSKFANRFIGDALSTLIWSQDFTTYQRDHVVSHHGKDFATMNDPDVVTLTKLMRIKPGMSKKELWTCLLKGLVSPRLHITFLRFRLRANFWTCPNYRKACSTCYAIGLLFLVAMTHRWGTLVWGWLFPLIVPYQISAVLQFCSRHFWLQPKGIGEVPKDHIARLTVGRFSGEPAPSSGLPLAEALLQWSVWWFRMLFIHLFWRMFVLVNSLPEHDWHHRYPASRSWATGPFERQRDIDAGHPGWPAYDEVWGFLNSVDMAFEMWSNLPKQVGSGPISLNDFEQTIASM